jgi:predicted DNA-binding antitoxin AbrB/MazE fold protein
VSIQVDAIYAGGVLRPLQPLDLAENEHVIVNVTKSTSAISVPHADPDYIETVRTELEGAGPAPGLAEVRRRLSRIPGEMTADFIEAREER